MVRRPVEEVWRKRLSPNLTFNGFHYCYELSLLAVRVPSLRFPKLEVRLPSSQNVRDNHVHVNIIRRPMVTVPLQPQNSMPRTESGGTKSSQSENDSQLLDGFLEKCTGMAPTYLAPADSVPSCVFNSQILTFPLTIIKKILRNLLTSPESLILEHDPITRPKDYRTYVEPKVLQVCQGFHNIGVPILYGENTLTSSSPTTSFDFDKSLLSLPGRKRQLLTNVKLEIDWADQLWAKFPLVARALGELRSLATLVIVMVEKESMMKQKRRMTSIEEDTDLKISFLYDRGSSSSNTVKTSRHQSVVVIDRADSRMMKREASVADAMLKAEMKMLKDLVTEIKSLRYFRLIGFGREGFAWSLEEHVRLGKQ